MTIKQLEYFSAVAKLLSFSKAAEQLYISQPALSRSILSLEEEIGAVLFDRNKHNVTLTPAGIVLASRLPKLSVDLSEIVAEAQQAHYGELGSMRLAIQNGLIIPDPVMGAFLEFTQPLSKAEIMPVCLDADDIQRSLREGKIEITYTCENLTPPGTIFETIQLLSDPACIAYNQERYKSEVKGNTISDFRSINFVMAGAESSLTVTRFKELCISQGFYPKITQVKDSSKQFFCIENGLGIGIFPKHHKIFENKDICCLPIVNVPAFSCTLQWSAKSANPVIDLFVGAVRLRLTESF